MHPDSVIYIPLQNKLDSQFREIAFRDFCYELFDAADIDATVSKFADELSIENSSNYSTLQKDKEYLAFLILKKVILDLINQGWQLEVNDSKLGLSYPLFPDNSKALVRKRHSFERRTQLENESVQKFIMKMEGNGIFSLMRDGKELAAILKEELKKGNPADVIKPYLQFVEGNQRCKHTGLKLMDIWRYFRYTWVNAYRSAPGRSIRILVRDAAAQNHAVIGIVSLGNAVIQQTVRDNWIGWHGDSWIRNFEGCSAPYLIDWCSRTIDKGLNEIYQKDLIDEGFYAKTDRRKPTSRVIDRLKQESLAAMKVYRQTPSDSEYLRRTEKPGADWGKRAKTHLYKSKRCAKLASLLSIRKKLVETGYADQTSLNQLIRFVKAEHVGENMMDITTCGAVAPYNHLLGGKLVSMLVCSPQVIEYYKDKYAKTERIIASSMKGAPRYA